MFLYFDTKIRVSPKTVFSCLQELKNQGSSPHLTTAVYRSTLLENIFCF